MEDYGYTVIRFGHADDWGQIAARLSAHLRCGAEHAGGGAREPGNVTGVELELELFEIQWHPLLHKLAQELGSGMIETRR